MWRIKFMVFLSLMRSVMQPMWFTQELVIHGSISPGQPSLWGSPEDGTARVINRVIEDPSFEPERAVVWPVHELDLEDGVLLLEDVPGSKEEVPGSKEDVPGSKEDVPGSKEDVPGRKEDVPGSKEDVPVSKDDVPGSKEDVPGRKEDVPDSEEEFLEYKEEFPVMEESPSTRLFHIISLIFTLIDFCTFIYWMNLLRKRLIRRWDSNHKRGNKRRKRRCRKNMKR